MTRRHFMYTLFVKRPAYSYQNRTQVFRSWKPGSANTLIGQRIGRFQFNQEIEQDAHNTVFRGQDIENDIPVVIKLFSPEVSQDEDYAHAFKAGIIEAESIESDGFAPILDAGMTTQNQLYVVTEDVGGISLHQWIYGEQTVPNWSNKFSQALDQQKAVADKQDITHGVFALRFAEQIASQLQTLAQGTVFHQNLSSSKILINSEDKISIIGLGIPERPTRVFNQTKDNFYPLPYHPPEKALSIQGHMFTLGVMLYEMLAGTRPFLQEKRSKYATKTSSIIVPLQDIRSGLSAETYALVNCCLQKSTWNRYAKVADLQLAIAAALQQETAVAYPFLDQQAADAPRLETPIVVAPAIDEKEVTLPEPPKPIPTIKRVKPIKKPAKQTTELQPVAETLAKAAVLPTPEPIVVEDATPEDIAEETGTTETIPTTRKRSKRMLAVPLVILLILLFVGGAFISSQNDPAADTMVTESEALPAVAAIVETATVDVTETAVAAVFLATPTPPTLQIIAPSDDEFSLTDTLLFQVRWPLSLAEEEALFIQVQENTWGEGTIIGAAVPQAEDSDIYELSIPIEDISKLEGTYWWLILYDSDGTGPGIGLPLSELRPLTIFAPTITPTRPTETPAATATATTETIACTRDASWVSYTIRSGDTLAKLAQNVGSSVEQILEGNCLSEVPVLTINSRILLPRAVTTQTSVPSRTPSPTPTPTPTPSPVPTTAPSNPSNPPDPTSVPPTATVPVINPTNTPPPLPTAVPTDVPPTATVPSLPTNTPVPPTEVPPTEVPPTATTAPPPATSTPEP